MPTPEQSEQFLDTPPEVAELVATHPEYGHDSRWDKLDAEDAPAVRQLQLIADKLRSEHADPGDALLIGYGFAKAVDREKADRQEFIERMGTPSFVVDDDA